MQMNNGPPTPFTSLYDPDEMPVVSSNTQSSLQPSLRRSFGPHLVVVRQNSAAEEKVTKNGVPKMAHVVIKNSPFVVTIGQEVPNGSSPLDFNEYAIDCTLIYDDDGADKMVDFVKNKPVEFKASPTDHGSQLHVEMRIKVLTSHHEDMFFRVLVQCLDPDTKMPIQDLSVRTNPIKVISKPEGIKKRPKRSSSSSTPSSAHATPAAGGGPPPATVPQQTANMGQYAAVLPQQPISLVQPKSEPPAVFMPHTTTTTTSTTSSHQQQQQATMPSIENGTRMEYNEALLGGGMIGGGYPGTVPPPPPNSQMMMIGNPPITATSAPLPINNNNSTSSSSSTSLMMMTNTSTLSSSTTTTPINSTSSTSSSRKRTLNDMVVEAITRIEKRQLDQQRILEEINEKYVKRQCFSWGGVGGFDPADSSCAQQQQQDGVMMPNGQQQQQQQMGVPGMEERTGSGLWGADFDVAFAVLLEAYCKLSLSERAMRVRRIIQMTTPAQVANISELVDLFASEGLGRELGRETRLSPTHGGVAGGSSGFDDIISLDFPTDSSGFPSNMSPPPH